MNSLLLALLLSQDDTLTRGLEALGSDDITVRERAFAELRKTPIEKLPLLEPALGSSDAELRGRVKELIGAVLCDALGKRLERFAAKAIAPREVMERWSKDGRDPARIPEGFERVLSPERFNSKSGEYEYLKGDEVLVESGAIIANEHIDQAEARESLRPDGSATWVTVFELTQEGAKRFDDAAARLFDQKPQGIMALLVDGAVVMAPVIQSRHFDGHGQVWVGGTRDRSEKTVGLLKGKWFGISCRVVAVEGSAAHLDEAVTLIQETPGLAEASVEKSGEKECTIRSTIDARQLDLVTLWRDLRRKGFALMPLK